MEEYNYENEMAIILAAGDSKVDSQRAIELAREGKFDEAREALKEANKKMNGAHKAQMNLLQQEMSGEPVHMSVMLVHSQDHIVMAQMSCEQAELAIGLFEKIYELSR